MISARLLTDSVSTMNHSRSRRRTLASRLVGVSLVLLMAAVGVPPAQAADMTTLIAFNPSKKTVTFGDEWYIPVKVTNHNCSYRDCTDVLTVTLTGDNGVTKTTKVSLYDANSSSKPASGNLSSYAFDDSLPAGIYTVTSTVEKFVRRDRDHPYRSPGATLTVKPAALTVDLRVESDATQPLGAVVSARLDGAFVENYNRCLGYEECRATPPAGRWDFTVTDEAGETIVEKSINVKSTDAQFASFYWHGVAAESDFTTTGTFTASDPDRGSFTVEQAGDVSFTSPDAAVTDTPETPVVVPEVEEVDPGSTIPVWVAAAWLLVLLLLIAACVTFGILVGRLSRTKKSEAVAEPVVQGELE